MKLIHHSHINQKKKKNALQSCCSTGLSPGKASPPAHRLRAHTGDYPSLSHCFLRVSGSKNFGSLNTIDHDHWIHNSFISIDHTCMTFAYRIHSLQRLLQEEMPDFAIPTASGHACHGTSDLDADSMCLEGYSRTPYYL